MERIAVPVSVAGHDHHGGVSNAVANSMIGRVFSENSEVVWVVYGAKLLFPNMRVVEEVIPEHVQHRHHTDGRAEKLRPLRDGRAYEQPGIRTSEDRELGCRGSSRLDEPFRC